MVFFLVLAALNEIVRRSVSTDTWVGFKTFGIPPLTVLFTLAQLPLLQRHELPAAGGGAGGEAGGTVPPSSRP
jgi:intracellular septation protein